MSGRNSSSEDDGDCATAADDDGAIIVEGAITMGDADYMDASSVDLKDLSDLIPLQEETGFQDPLGSSHFDNFDLVSFVGHDGTELPIDSPLAAPSTFADGLFHQQGGVHFQNQPKFAAAGLMMHYTAVAATMGNRSHRQQHLPDSPPITDISGGNSSASPSSGNTNNNHSPLFMSTAIAEFPYQQQPQQQQQNHPRGSNSNKVAVQQLLLQQQQQQRMTLGARQDQHQNSPPIHPSGGYSQQQQQQQFASPYPPSQLTPGSGSQVSPPSLTEYQQQPLSGGGLDASPSTYLGPATSMDQLYAAAAAAAAAASSSSDGYPQPLSSRHVPHFSRHHLHNQQHFEPLQQHQQLMEQIGSKRRRRASCSSNVVEYGGGDAGCIVNGGGLMLDCGVVKSEVYSNGGTGSGGSGSSLDVNNDGYSPLGNSASFYGSGGGQVMPAGLQRFFTSGLEKENCYDGNGLLVRPPPHSEHSSFDEFADDVYCSGSQRTIKFSPYVPEQWNPLFGAERRDLPPMGITVVADKGFNYSLQDNCFVNQKKNHFQVTVNISVNPTTAQAPTIGPGPTCQASSQNQITTSNPFTPYYVGNGTGDLLPIHDFQLMFCGAKSETPTSEIHIKQSQTDRRPIPYDPVHLTLDGSLGSVKQTIPRLHFSETTMNNHRKGGKPNPEQKYFLLVIKLMANVLVDGGREVRRILVQAYQSDRVIVRASNPGQFEQPETEVAWQKTSQGALAFQGQVCIGTLQPERDAQLTVMGDIVTSGKLTRPSDRRVKEDIVEHDAKEALDRLAQLRIVDYAYKPEIAEKWGLTEESRHRVGVIAQELAEVLPDAVRDNGEILTVDDTRIFYETVAAAQELCRLTGNLECKINQVELISQKLARFAQRRKDQAQLRGSTWSGISDFSSWMFGNNLMNNSRKMESTKVSNNNSKDDDLRETKSCMSYLSRTSLTSIASEDGSESASERANGGGRRRGSAPSGSRSCGSDSISRIGREKCCRHHRSPTGPAVLCNSRLTQGTIVTLVIVMALCLVAMCTLYVLDWYNRSYVYQLPHHFYPPMMPGGNGTIPPGSIWPMPGGGTGQRNDIGEIRAMKWPPSQSPGLQLSATCAASSLSTTMLDSLAEVALPLAAAIPRCPTYCCTVQSHYEAFSVPQPNTAALAPSHSPSLPSSLKKNTIAADQLPFDDRPPAVLITVPAMNATIDERYCVRDDLGLSSCDGRNGRHNLYIPVSAHLPTIPLEVQFRVDDPAKFVDSCGPLHGFSHKRCPRGATTTMATTAANNTSSGKTIEEVPTVYRLTSSDSFAQGPIFELSVGRFLQSAYSFRVGYAAGPGAACHSPPEQRGRSFDEYNLIFYRTCASSSSASSSDDPPKSKVGGSAGRQNHGTVATAVEAIGA